MEQPQNVSWPRPGPRMSAPTGAPTHTNSLENSSVQTPHTHTADSKQGRPRQEKWRRLSPRPPTLTPSQQQADDEPLKRFANSLNMQKEYEKLFGKRVMTRTRCR